MLTHAIFVAAFTSLVAYYYPQIVEDVLYRNSFENKHKHLLLKEYDFIIIGAGSAGSVLARRLVLAADWKVLLLEAGGEETYESRTPLFHFFQHHTSLDWNYTTVAQKNACLNTEGICYYPRGHGMGGSSSINGLMYVRGNKDDYDGWAGSDPTASYWSYQNVKQYFKRLERVSLGDREVSTDRGTDGLLTVQHAKYQSKLALDLIKAGEELGVKSKDYNGPEQISFSIPQLTVDGPRRKSVASAYIDSLYTDFKYYDKIVNLDIIRGAFVNKITINDETKTAQSVQFTYDDQKYELKANKEIILSAGVINTPKILMLSGVGPKKQLINSP